MGSNLTSKQLYQHKGMSSHNGNNGHINSKQCEWIKTILVVNYSIHQSIMLDIGYPVSMFCTSTSTKQQLCYIHSVTNWSFQELPFSVGPCNLALGIILCLCTILLSIQPWSTQAVQSSMCHINSIQCIPTGLCGIRGITINIFTWLLLCTAKCKESKSPRQGPLRNCHIINDPLR